MIIYSEQIIIMYQQNSRNFKEKPLICKYHVQYNITSNSNITSVIYIIQPYYNITSVTV